MRFTWLIYIFILFQTINTSAQNQSFSKTLDSIQNLRKLTYDNNLNEFKRLNYAIEASRLSNISGIDSVILNSNRRLAYTYLDIGKYKESIELGKKNLILAHKVNDSSALAYINYNLGWLFENNKAPQFDKAYNHYFKASKLFSKLKDKKVWIEVLINIAGIQEFMKDYVGAESNISIAIRNLKTLPETNETLSDFCSLYNLLGIISYRNKFYEKAIEYLQKSIVISHKISSNYKEGMYIIPKKHVYFLHASQNMAIIYRDKKEFKKAIKLHENILLNSDLFIKYPFALGSGLNELAYTKFLSKSINNKEIYNLYKEAYKIFDNLNESVKIVSISNNISEYFISINQKDSAFKYLEKSYKTGKTIHENEEVLRSLKLLSQASEGETSKQYLLEYIKLNDSLIDKERSMRNKFARVKFETDEVIAQNKKINKDRTNLAYIAAVLLIGAMLIYIIYSERLKNKQLTLESHQQKANEEIYSLMLAQQSKIEESRNMERNRISEDLHDGVLSKLFGTRIGFGFLATKLSGDQDSLENFNERINDIQSIEQEIRNVSHELNKNLLIAKTNFITIVDYYLKNQSELHLFNYQIQNDDAIHWNKIEDGLKVNLFRIIQEALQNTIKHAGASEITIQFSLKESSLNLTIKDDGNGFNPQKKTTGIGLKNMKSRVEKLKGKFSIDSKPKTGTTIAIMLPINS